MRINFPSNSYKSRGIKRDFARFKFIKVVRLKANPNKLLYYQTKPRVNDWMDDEEWYWYHYHNLEFEDKS